VGKVVNGKILYVVRLGKDYVDEKYVSGDYNSLDNVILVMWENSDNDNHTFIEGAFIDPDTLLTVNYIHVRDNGLYQYYPVVVSCMGLFYVFYINSIDEEHAMLQCIIMDPSSRTAINKIHIAEVSNDRKVYPRTISSNQGVLVIWLDTRYNNSLIASLVNQSGVLWIKVIDTKVTPYCYGVTYMPKKGYMLIYKKTNGYTKAAILGGNGEIITRYELVPDIAYKLSVFALGGQILVYTGLNKVNIIALSRDNLLSVIGFRLIPYPSVVEVALIYDGNSLEVVEPKPWSNNTLTIAKVDITLQHTQYGS